MKSLKPAYIFLIILLLILGYVTFLKFTYVKPESNDSDINIKSISLSTIANNYNSKTYEVDSSATINGTTLEIMYNNKKYIFNYANGILKLDTVLDDNTNMLFTYLVDAVSMAKNNGENASLITTNLIINSLYFNESVKVIKNNNNVMYVIDTTKPMTLYKADNIYNDVKILNINDKNYDIDINDIKIISPVISYNNETNSFDIKGYLDNINKKEATIKINLYDKDKKSVKEEVVNITKDTSLLVSSLKIDELSQNDIIYYSFEIN